MSSGLENAWRDQAPDFLRSDTSRPAVTIKGRFIKLFWVFFVQFVEFFFPPSIQTCNRPFLLERLVLLCLHNVSTQCVNTAQTPSADLSWDMTCDPARAAEEEKECAVFLPAIIDELWSTCPLKCTSHPVYETVWLVTGIFRTGEFLQNLLLTSASLHH